MAPPGMRTISASTAPFTEAHPHLTIEWQTWSEIPGEAFWEAVESGQAVDVCRISCMPWWSGDAVPLVTRGAWPLHPARRLRPHRLLARCSGAQHLARRVYGCIPMRRRNWCSTTRTSCPPAACPCLQRLDLAAPPRPCPRADRPPGRQTGLWVCAQPYYGFPLTMNFAEKRRNYPATIPWIWANGGDIVDADSDQELGGRAAGAGGAGVAVCAARYPCRVATADEVSGDELFKIGRLAMLHGPRSFTMGQADSSWYGLAAGPSSRPVVGVSSEVRPGPSSAGGRGSRHRRATGASRPTGCSCSRRIRRGRSCCKRLTREWRRCGRARSRWRWRGGDCQGAERHSGWIAARAASVRRPAMAAMTRRRPLVPRSAPVGRGV